MTMLEKVRYNENMIVCSTVIASMGARRGGGGKRGHLPPLEIHRYGGPTQG